MGEERAEVTSIGANGKHTIDDVARWCDLAADKGYYPANSARLYKTALVQMAAVLVPDESHAPEWVLEHLDELAARYANKHMPTQGTLRTYQSKARTLLHDFVEFKKNPVAFKPRGRASGSPATPSRESKSTKGVHSENDPGVPKTDTANASSAPRRTEASHPLPQTRDYPLGAGRLIHFSLPENGLTFGEVKKFALHLITLANDFDLSDPDQVEVLSMVKRK